VPPEPTTTSENLLVVGLGNPGEDYGRSRHNLGFVCVHELARRRGLRIDRRRWSGLVAPPAGGRGVWLLLPQTFMNESGRAVARARRDLALEPGRIWVVHDELDLPFCRLRIQIGGSAAGHNGVQSILGALGSPDFVRFRIGVGRPPHAAAGARYVLGGFSRREAERLDGVVEGVVSALELALESGLERAMGLYNRAGALGCEEPA